MLLAGYTLMHEHVTIDLSGVKKDDDCRLDEKEKTIEEFRALKELGVHNILEVTNLGMGRNAAYIRDVAQASGMNILMCTGFYKEPFLPDYVYEKTVSELADLMISELESGIEDTGIKASAIGEIGTSRNAMTEMERKVFTASAKAAAGTGALITTHTTLGALANEQLDLLISEGVDPARVVIGHMDLNSDPDYILSVLDRGANIGFDTVGKLNYQSDEYRIGTLKKIFQRGYGRQVVLSMDITRKSHLKANGGPGYSYIMTSFIPALYKAGFTCEDVHMMLCSNPERLLERRG